MQDLAVTRMGEILLDEMGNLNPYELFTQNMFPDKEAYDMIIAVFEKHTENDLVKIKFAGVDSQKVSAKNYLRYGYRKGSSRGGDITFTTKFGDIEKKLNTLINNQLTKLLAHPLLPRYPDELKTFEALMLFFQVKENSEYVTQELKEVHASLDKKAQMSSGLSIIIKEEGKESYVTDFAIVRDIINASGTDEKSFKYEVLSEGHNEKCSICMTEQPILHGFASPFMYATVDKPGMVSGFFNQKNNWKNYPICTSCSLKFEVGRSHVTSKFSKYFYGKSYYAIPKTLLRNDTKGLRRAMKYLETLYDNILTESKTTERNEDNIFRLVGEIEKDYFNLNLLFYEENQTTKAIKIKLFLEEILPSRFRKLFIEAVRFVNDHPLYQNALYTKKGGQKNLEFRFGILKTFFEDDFYVLIQKVFMLESISKDVLYTKFMNVIRDNYNRQKSSDGYVENTRISILKAHLLLNYFQYLGLINYNQNYQLMNDETKKESKSAFDIEKLHGFVKENAGFLDEDYKVGIFSVGILVRLLLNIQQRELGNTPFENKLRGYNISPDMLQRIYLDALTKISQYQTYYTYNNLKEFVANYYVLNSQAIKKTSNNELSFYFVAGLEFGGRFKTEKDEVETTENN
jgi:CRISPR-associated protein Csh1